MVTWRKKIKKEPVCIEDPNYAEIRKTMLSFERKFSFYILFSIVYGLLFVNYIDVIVVGSNYNGYHLWLIFMYFFPFAVLTMLFPRNWALTVGLGLIVSLMNDVFYGSIRYLMGFPLDLNRYYNLWLVPSGTTLFTLNLGFTAIPVYSWMMALSIYGRIVIVYFLLEGWKFQAKIRCLSDKGKKKNYLPWLKS